MAHDEIDDRGDNVGVVDSDTSAAASAAPAPRSGSPVPGGPAHSRNDSGERRRFDVVLRGYERGSVDEHLARVAEETAVLRRELADSERRRVLAEQHATATESENRTLRSEQHAGRVPQEESFGYLAEKLLRMAEQEAADVRGTAAREAASLLEQVRAEAEQHRHGVEQSLIARSALLDQQAVQRTVELQEREQQIAAQVIAAKAEVEGLHEAAGRAADRHRQQAEADAESARRRAEQDARRLREQAEHEVARLGALRDGVRAEIARLAEVLADGLRVPGGGRGQGRPDPRSRRQPSPGPASQPGSGPSDASPSDASPSGTDDAEPARRAAAAAAAGR